MELTHTVEALLFVASEPLTAHELAEAAGASVERIERAIDALAETRCEGRSGVVLDRVGGGWAFRAADATAEACSRLFGSAAPGSTRDWVRLAKRCRAACFDTPNRAPISVHDRSAWRACATKWSRSRSPASPASADTATAASRHA